MYQVKQNCLKLLVVVCLMAGIAGCGQKGDLYMPDNNATLEEVE